MKTENEKVTVGSGREGPSGLAPGARRDTEKAESDFSGGSPSVLPDGHQPSPPGEGEGSSASGTSCGKTRSAEDGAAEPEGEERGVATAEEVLGKKGRRPRSDTAVRRLTPEQRAKVDAWLFDELLSYEEVATRCREELGLIIAANSIGGYCRQEQGVRSRRKADAGVGYTALLEGMNQAALRALERLELGNDPRVLAEYARVLVSARQEANHSLRASTTREKFEFDAATACLVHQVRVQSIVEDETLTDEERVRSVREELFGPDLPD
jgi:hypothetical protein